MFFLNLQYKKAYCFNSFFYSRMNIYSVMKFSVIQIILHGINIYKTVCSLIKNIFKSIYEIYILFMY